MEFHEINDPAGRPHEEIGAEQEEPVCQHEHRRINLSTAFLACADCGEQLLDLNPFIARGILRVAR